LIDNLQFNNASEPIVHTLGIMTISTHTALKKYHINISKLIGKLTYDFVKDEGLR